MTTAKDQPDQFECAAADALVNERFACPDDYNSALLAVAAALRETAAREYGRGRREQREADLVIVENVKTSDDTPLDGHHERYKAGYGTGYLDACDEITRRIRGER